jgi:hypothetical protein
MVHRRDRTVRGPTRGESLMWAEHLDAAFFMLTWEGRAGVANPADGHPAGRMSEVPVVTTRTGDGRRPARLPSDGYFSVIVASNGTK